MMEQAAEMLATAGVDLLEGTPSEMQQVLEQLNVIHQDLWLVIVCLSLLVGLLCAAMIVKHWRV